MTNEMAMQNVAINGGTTLSAINAGSFFAMAPWQVGKLFMALAAVYTMGNATGTATRKYETPPLVSSGTSVAMPCFDSANARLCVAYMIPSGSEHRYFAYGTFCLGLQVLPPPFFLKPLCKLTKTSGLDARLQGVITWAMALSNAAPFTDPAAAGSLAMCVFALLLGLEAARRAFTGSDAHGLLVVCWISLVRPYQSPFPLN